MTTSLATSPIVPIAMAGVAAVLIFGTLNSASTAAPDAAADSSGLPAAENPAALPDVPALTGNQVTADCKGKVCTITFPAAGDSAQAFGTTVQAVKFYVDGMEVSVGGQSIVSSLKVANKAGGYTLKIVKVGPSGQTVKITKK